VHDGAPPFEKLIRTFRTAGIKGFLRQSTTNTAKFISPTGP